MKRAVALLLVIALAGLSGCAPEPTELPENIGGGIQEVDPYSLEGDGQAGGVAVTSEKTAYNPLSGLYDMAEDRVGLRPIAVSVNNISVSWPQYGTSEADYIVEIETEGGITRLMCVFSDTREIDQIGSVRSLRDQFIEALFPMNPVIIHIGTSIYADRAIAQYNFRSLDGGNYTATIFTDAARRGVYSSEHTKFTSGDSIEKGIEAAKIMTENNSKESAFRFIEPDAEKVVPGSGDASAVNYDFSSGYDGDFRYDAETGTYLKWQFGRQQMDAGTGTQLAFDNVFLLFAPMQLYPGQSAGLVDVTYTEGGEGYYFSQGRYEEITWRKDDYISNFTFIKKSDGTELDVNVGKTHLGVIRTTLADTLTITP